MSSLPHSLHGDHVRLSVRLTPAGGRDAFDGLEAGADGMVWLKVRVSAPPEDGKANRALVQLLAKRLRIAKSAIHFISGETARKKILRIEGDPEEIMKVLSALAGA